MLIKDPNVQLFFEYISRTSLLLLSLNILKRLIAIETVLELNDYPIEGYEAESTIPRQISLLFDQIKAITKSNNK